MGNIQITMRKTYVTDPTTLTKVFAGMEISDSGNGGDIWRGAPFFGQEKQLTKSIQRNAKKNRMPGEFKNSNVTCYEKNGAHPYVEPYATAHMAIRGVTALRRTKWGVVLERFWTDEEAAALLYMHQAGMTDAQIAKVFNCEWSKRHICSKRAQMVRKGHLEYSRRKKKISFGGGKWTNLEVAVFGILWEKGMDVPRIAEILGRSYSSCAGKRFVLFSKGNEVFAPRKVRA